MKYLKTHEEINYYKYTFDEVEKKIFGNNRRDTLNILNQDENLLYLLEMYIIYREGYKNTTPNDITISSFSRNHGNIVIFYNLESLDTWIVIKTKEEQNFIDFINDPELFKEMKKYNL